MADDQAGRLSFEIGNLKIIGRNRRLRIAVGAQENRRSNLWRVAVRKSDVYVSTGGAAPIKFSFHESGICRDAFTSEFGIPPGMEDRAMKKWKRAEVPPANTEQACSVLEVVVPTDFLSSNLQVPPNKEICWVDAAPPGRSTSFEMFFSADPPDVAEPLMQRGQRNPIAAIRLDNGTWFYVASHQIEFAGQATRIPAAGNRKFDYLIAPDEDKAHKRSARILLTSSPQDGDKLIAWEYGASRVEAGTDFPVDGTLTPHRIFHSTSWENK